MGFTFFWNRKKKEDKKWQPASSAEKLPLVSHEVKGSSLQELYSQELFSKMQDYWKNAAVVFSKEVPQDKAFYLADGRALKSLADLEVALRTMSIQVYEHHVNSGRNDFSNWVRDVMAHKELADDLMRNNTRETTLRALERLK